MDAEKNAKEEERAQRAAQEAKSRQAAQVQQREEATKDLIASLPEGTSVAFQLDPAILTSVVKAIACVDEDEASFEATEDGIYFKQMDPSHISLLEATVPAKACNTYHYQSKTPSVHFTVRVAEFLGLLKLASVNDQLTFMLEGDHLQCNAGPSRTHKINLYETTHSAAPLPKIDFEAKVVLVKTDLQKMLRECTVAGEEQVTITAEGTQIAFKAKSDFGVSEVKLHKFDAEVLDLIVSGRQSATYSVSYLFGILKAVGVADMATVEWSTRKPLKMTLPLANVEYGANVIFWLAPRVSDDSEPAKEPDEGPKPAEQPNETPPDQTSTETPSRSPAETQPSPTESPKRKRSGKKPKEIRAQ